MDGALVVPTGLVVVVVEGVVGAPFGEVVVVVDVVGATVVEVVVVEDVLVVVVVVVVVVGGGLPPPQNWMLEMSGTLPAPTSGRPSFVKWRLVCGGENDTTTAFGPPLTTIAMIGIDECASPPVAEPLVMTTTFWFPLGFSNTYVPPWKLNLAISSEPLGQFELTCDDVVRSSPTPTSVAPSCKQCEPAEPWIEAPT